MIKAIIFDLGGVFFSIDYVSELKKLVKSFPEIPAKKVKFITAGKLSADYRLGKYTKKEFWKKAEKVAGTKIDIKRFSELWHSGYKIDRKVRDLIKKLRKHYKIGALSGNTRERIKFLDDKYDFKKYFDRMVLSYNVGANKPNIKIYKEMLKKLNLKGKNCIFIDDTEPGLNPAKKLGMKTIHFKNSSQLKKDLSRYVKI